MVLKIIGVLIALVLMLLGYPRTRPDSFRVERKPPSKTRLKSRMKRTTRLISGLGRKVMPH